MGAQLTQLCAAYNQALDQALDRLALAGIPTIRLDAFAVLNRMANEPAIYGFSNVTVPLTLAPSGVDPEQFLFWDPVHPTTGAHEVLAEEEQWLGKPRRKNQRFAWIGKRRSAEALSSSLSMV